jgi:TonB-linked SusC/RagA family outer membrane protein
MKRLLFVPAIFLAIAMLQPAAAQEGVVEGQVVEAQSGAPLPGVNVTVQGEQIGASTDQEGTYTISNVPSGTQVIEARFVGFQTETQEVDVSAGETIVVDFEMQEARLGLDEVVVTGTGGEVQQRSIGHTVSRVDFSGVEDIGTKSIEDALVGKEAGVSINMSSGSIDQEPRIRIRGSSSISMSNEPLVYVDGVRINSTGGFAPGVSAGGRGQTSALSQLNFDAIERVEILKGPAAATLYGSQANAGVIQIFTKTGGQEQAPQFDIELSNTFHRMPDRFEPIYGYVDNEQAQTRVQNVLGVDAELYEPFRGPHQLIDLYGTGMGQEISGSVRGGGQGATYYTNVRYSFTDGPWNPQSSSFNGGEVGDANDTNRRFFWTGNLSLIPTDQWRFNVQAEYSRTDRETYGQGITIYTPTSTTRYANPANAGVASEFDTFGLPFFATPREGTYPQIEDASNRGRVVLQSSYLPTENLSADLQFGIDYNSQQSQDYSPFGYAVDGVAPTPDGLLIVADRSVLTYSVETKLDWSTSLGENFNSGTVVGGQLYRTETETSTSDGQNFPGPGLRTVDATSIQNAASSFEEVADVGTFVQEQIDYREAVYLTLGARLDASSAFGDDFNYATYPKASLSFLPADLFDFSISGVSEIRFRGAWGQSGQQPGAFDAFTTFQPVQSPEGTGVRTENLGNDELQPETATEWEVGFDLGLLRDRVSLSATYWNRTTSDALIARSFPPSGGFANPQLTNAGELLGQGFEFSLDGGVVQSENFSLDAFANAAYLYEEVTSLGGAPPIKIDPAYARDRMFIKEGYAPGAYFGTAPPENVDFPLDLEQNGTPSSQQALEQFFSQPRNPTELRSFYMPAGADGQALPGGSVFKDNYLGKQTPDWSGAAGFTARYQGFALSTRFRYAFGNYYHHNLTSGFQQVNSGIGRNTETSATLDATLQDPESTTQERIDAARTWVNDMLALTPHDGLNEIERADYVRWQNLSLSYTIPSALASTLGVDESSISIQGNNIALWTRYDGVDPTATGEAATGVPTTTENNFASGMDTYGTPQLRTYTITLEASF